MNLKHALQNIFGESLLEKEEFIQTFSTEIHYIRTIMSDGAVILCDPLRKTDDISDTHINEDGSTVEKHQNTLKALFSLCPARKVGIKCLKFLRSKSHLRDYVNLPYKEAD